MGQGRRVQNTNGPVARHLARIGIILAALATLATLYATLSPRPPGPELQGQADKLAHFAAFLIIVFPAIVTRPRRWRWVVPGAIALGGLIELIQPSFGRHAEWMDFWANNAGILAGALAGAALHPPLRRWQMRRRA